MATPERTGGDERARARAGHEYPQLYAPKALVLLSHYPFYNLFTQFLQQVWCVCVCHRGQFGREHGWVFVRTGRRAVGVTATGRDFRGIPCQDLGVICGLSLVSGLKRRLGVWEKKGEARVVVVKRRTLDILPVDVGEEGGRWVHACILQAGSVVVWLLLPVMRFGCVRSSCEGRLRRRRPLGELCRPPSPVPALVFRLSLPLLLFLVQALLDRFAPSSSVTRDRFSTFYIFFGGKPRCHSIYISTIFPSFCLRRLTVSCSAMTPPSLPLNFCARFSVVPSTCEHQNIYCTVL